MSMNCFRLKAKPRNLLPWPQTKFFGIISDYIHFIFDEIEIKPKLDVSYQILQ